MSKSIVSEFPPEVYYRQQAAGLNYYPVFQGGRSFGSLFEAAKNIALPFMKNVVLPVMKAEVRQLIQDETSGKKIKRSLKACSKRVEKRIITKALTTGRGRAASKKCKTKRTPIRHHSTRQRRRTADKTAQQFRERLLMQLA